MSLSLHDRAVLQRSLTTDSDDAEPEEDRTEDKWRGYEPMIAGDKHNPGEERKDNYPKRDHNPLMKMLNKYHRPSWAHQKKAIKMTAAMIHLII